MDIESLELEMNGLNEIERAYRDGTLREWHFPPDLVTHEEGLTRVGRSLFFDLPA